VEAEEELPVEQGDDELPEDRNLLLEQLQNLSLGEGAVASLLRIGHGFLQGTADAQAVRTQAAQLESQLDGELDDPLLLSQFDRLEEGLGSNLPDQVLYALLGLGCQLKPLD